MMFFVSQRRMTFWQTSPHVCGSRTERTSSQLVRVRVLNLDLTVQGLHLIIHLDSKFSFTDGLLMDVMLQVALGPLQTPAGAACFDVDR